MTMKACRECNSNYSRDEEYMSALLGAVLAGSTEPSKQNTVRANKLERQPALRERIEQSWTTMTSLFGETETMFIPEEDRVKRIVIKNARGHVLYELDRWLSKSPSNVNTLPLQCLTQEQRDNFEGATEHVSVWPEIGTRMFMRLCFSTDPNYPDVVGPWVVVQDNYYRFWLEDVGEGVLVRSVIHEYLATEVYWSEEKTD